MTERCDPGCCLAEHYEAQIESYARKDAEAQTVRWLAEQVVRLRSALIEIEKQYANQDMNHVDFRVMAKCLADEALEQK